MLQNCRGETFLAFTGHMMRLSEGARSSGRHVAGATRGSSASRNASKVEPVILKFWIHASSVESQTVTSQNSLMCGHSHVSFQLRTALNKSINIHPLHTSCNARGENSFLLLSHHSLDIPLWFINILKISLRFCAILSIGNPDCCCKLTKNNANTIPWEKHEAKKLSPPPPPPRSVFPPFFASYCSR